MNLICAIDKETSAKKTYSKISEVLKAINKNNISHWLMPTQGFKLRAEINHFFDVNSIQGRIVFESDVIESLVRSVVDKIGIAFLPLVYVPKELEDKSLYSFGPKKG